MSVTHFIGGGNLSNLGRFGTNTEIRNKSRCVAIKSETPYRYRSTQIYATDFFFPTRPSRRKNGSSACSFGASLFLFTAKGQWSLIPDTPFRNSDRAAICATKFPSVHSSRISALSAAVSFIHATQNRAQ